MNDSASQFGATTYEINGFRSLLNFNIELAPGLNILVGPNGSGKTNYIQFLGFLTYFIFSGAATAVSSLGGVAKVFSIENSRKRAPSITVRIDSVSKISGRRDGKGEGHFRFAYELNIVFNRSSSSIYVKRESIRFGKLSNNGKPPNEFVGYLTVDRKTSADDVAPKFYISPRLFSRNPINPFYSTPDYVSKELKSNLEHFEPGFLGPDESILSSRRYGLPALDAVRNVLTRGQAFNIVPMKAREPDDLVRPPYIAPDGSGLSSTLHYMQAQRNPTSGRQMARLRRIPKESLDLVIEWTKLVLPQLSDINVAQDPHTGKYLATLNLGTTSTVKIPLQMASDGTVKWLALICLIITGGDIYTIEEPENYLHPKMQQYLLSLIRDSFMDSDDFGFQLLSTHSETLINMTKPREMIVFRYVGGRTQCHRIANPDAVMSEINKTGFGLGYYYANNAIS